MTKGSKLFLQWHGPFRWFGEGPDVVFGVPMVQRSGLYAWTIHVNDHYVVYYVGQTGRTFKIRLEEHTSGYLSGLYRIYDPRAFATGRKELVWEGMWRRGTEGRTWQFLNGYPQLAVAVHQLLALFRVFLVPFDADERFRERVEAALLRELRGQTAAGFLVDDDLQSRPRLIDEDPVVVEMQLPVEVVGVGDTLEV